MSNADAGATDADRKGDEVNSGDAPDLLRRVTRKVEELRDWMVREPEELRSWERVKEVRARLDEISDLMLDLPEPKRTETFQRLQEFRALLREMQAG